MTSQTVLPIRLELIDVPANRLRNLDPAWVDHLAGLIEISGLKQPILVRPKGERFELVAGEHRHAAVTKLGHETIMAVVEELTDDEARLAEIDENLVRRELSVLDRAIFLAERKAVWERMYPETQHGGDRKSLKSRDENQVANLATRFSADAAEKVGMSERSVQRACNIAASLTPDTIAQLRGTYLVDHQRDLEAFVAMSPDSQKIALTKIAGGEAQNIREAFRQPGEVAGPPPVTAAKLLDLWSRASAKEKRQFLSLIKVPEDVADTVVNPRRRTKES